MCFAKVTPKKNHLNKKRYQELKGSLGVRNDVTSVQRCAGMAGAIMTKITDQNTQNNLFMQQNTALYIRNQTHFFL